MTKTQKDLLQACYVAAGLPVEPTPESETRKKRIKFVRFLREQGWELQRSLKVAYKLYC